MADTFDKIKLTTRALLSPQKPLRVARPTAAAVATPPGLAKYVRQSVALQMAAIGSPSEQAALGRYAAKTLSIDGLIDMAARGDVTFKFVQAVLDAREKAIQQFFKAWQEDIALNAKLDNEAHERSRRVEAQLKSTAARATEVAAAAKKAALRANQYRRRLQAIAPRGSALPVGYSGGFKIDLARSSAEGAFAASSMGAGEALAGGAVGMPVKVFASQEGPLRFAGIGAQRRYKLSSKPVLVRPLPGAGGVTVRGRWLLR